MKVILYTEQWTCTSVMHPSLDEMDDATEVPDALVQRHRAAVRALEQTSAMLAAYRGDQ